MITVSPLSLIFIILSQTAPAIKPQRKTFLHFYEVFFKLIEFLFFKLIEF